MKKTLALSAALAACALVVAGCKSSLGTDKINLTGSVARDGKIVDVAVNVSSNSVGLAGGFQAGTNAYSGAVTIEK
ncbi:MAG TPA: hypothetical protein VHB20_14585 [Verrucomicrobiae bacterium]|jgi:hypothetical protein|nr:hypothetical protein [Verrucomicrobiae bacterium]